MRHHLIPEGWEYVSFDEDEEDAWRLAAEYKQLHERVNSDVFVRVRAVWAPHARAWWILRRVETREATA